MLDRENQGKIFKSYEFSAQEREEKNN